jgi:NAD(P)-dependent dehydrogenase (short-subunit alcohol dehydrogenase family)
MSGVQERVVVVTGAGRGLGREYAKLLAAEGAKVVVNDLGGARDGTGVDPEVADKVVAEIEESGGTAVASYDSVASPEGAHAIVQRAIDSFGAVHGVVSNAGTLRDSSFAKLADADWDAILRVHLDGAYHVIKAAWPYFRAQSFGRIVVATSNTGLYGNFGQANYGAAKLGLVGLINTLAIEGARSNITANAVAPLAATRLTEDVAPPDWLSKYPPAFVAPVVAHLMAEENADTAAVFVAGGGLVQRVQQFENAGVTFAAPPTVAELARRWPEITDMAHAVPARNILM